MHEQPSSQRHRKPRWRELVETTGGGKRLLVGAVRLGICGRTTSGATTTRSAVGH